MKAKIDNSKIYKSRKEGSFQRLEASEIIFKVISYTFVGIFALMCLYPLVYSLSSAISAYDPVASGKIVLFPMGFQLEAFASVFEDKYFWASFCNTFFITFFGTVYCMIISIAGGYALAKTELFGHKFFNFILIFTMWFAAGTIPMYLNYKATGSILQNNLGIADQKWLVVIAMGMNAFNIILLRNAFQSVPKEIEEAAIIDGATDFQIMSKISVPMSKATIATVGLFYGISRWNGYFWASKVVDSSLDFPLQVYIQRTIKGIEEDLALGGSVSVGTFAPQSTVYAMIVCAIIPILIIYPFIQKYFTAGVNLGGVKE